MQQPMMWQNYAKSKFWFDLVANFPLEIFIPVVGFYS